MFVSKSDCERIDGNMYYYLHISGTFTVFVYMEHDMYKIAHDVPTIEQAKFIANTFAKIRKDLSQNE